ncbi:MAG: Rieske 2Fe-2S domain-containing protein [Reichenbachiella sp.]|uniref:Rieske (2Fe-2S) protein n=1 Tax=Reichenbachiella sp. TaxID=2184521 RepID=UPI00326419FE
MNKYLVFETKEQAEATIPLNRIKKIRLDNRLYCLARNIEGFRVFEKSCPHLGEDLSKGNLNPAGEIVCPWHSFRFSLFSGDESQKRCRSLNIYRTEWENGQLFVWV